MPRVPAQRMARFRTSAPEAPAGTRRFLEPRTQRLDVSAERRGIVAERYPHRDYWRRRMLELADACGIAAALLLATSIAGKGVQAGHVWWALITLPGWIVLFAGYGLYSRDLRRVSHSTVDDAPWLFHALIVGTLLSWLYYEAVQRPVPTRELLVFAALAFAIVLVLRTTARRISAAVLAAERVLVLGDDVVTVALARKMRAHREYGLDPVGVLGAKPPPDEARLPLLGTLDDLLSVAERHSIERVIVSHAGLNCDDQVAFLRRCRALGVKVSVLPHLFDALGTSVEVDDVEGMTVLGLNPPVLSRSSRIVKRAVDICGSVLLAIPVAPVMVAAAAAIKLTSKGPVLFKQRRIGRRGEPFELLKFRTMYAEAEEQLDELRALSRDPHWLHLDHDPRVTPVGRFLRRTSLDELPQLWNVLKGEMSLVGPRPLIESEDRLVDGWGRSRLALTPGVTGLWQVLGRTDIPFEEMVKLDYLYVANWSVWGDISLIFRTLPAVLSRRGAN